MSREIKDIKNMNGSDIQLLNKNENVIMYFPVHAVHSRHMSILANFIKAYNLHLFYQFD